MKLSICLSINNGFKKQSACLSVNASPQMVDAILQFTKYSALVIAAFIKLFIGG
ncbi:hypothetical protein N5853_09460 [Bartonella sp. HY329]|uniref:hypothetical protein n=1 Tax=unclassified Bartonella TaxID=2645622 RepID=UPI0021C901AA|nr:MULTISPECIES: hypothetical protein [unclassified Bartonella]UXM94334.1 hypothetical protein N5853_09460 [Bartonella sp. HY329]UXN08657.1 hypothetical protein N5852_09470 [Bartonella sp. HY328]